LRFEKNASNPTACWQDKHSVRWQIFKSAISCMAEQNEKRIGSVERPLRFSFWTDKKPTKTNENQQKNAPKKGLAYG
jgi:hypothetical protein